MAYSKKIRILGAKEIYQKACSFCAYQERLQDEVRQKLKTFYLDDEEIEEIISQLILDNFLNEERFAISYAGGKFRIKKWGRLKIVRQLEMKKVSAYCIKKAMAEISEEDYRKTLIGLLQDKWEKLEEDNMFVRKHKVSQYLIGKGYEPELVWQFMDEVKNPGFFSENQGL